MTTIQITPISPENQASVRINDAQSVIAAMQSRFSCRAFTAQAPTKELVNSVLEAALRAPSGSNTQPWKIYVVQGAKRDELVQKVCAAHNEVAQNPELAKTQYAEPYDYYPETWISPYIERRRACGFGLYGVLGIAKGEHLKMHLQQQRNFRYFDAPIGLHFTLDKVMGRGSMLDYGMFLQNIMLAARAVGLHTCPQAAWNMFDSIVLPHLGAGPDEMLVCSMALGYADEGAVVNTFRTVREPLAQVVNWLE